MICNTYKLFFGTLADPTKLEILQVLKENPCNVSAICTKLKQEQSCISHNLRRLKELGFVTMIPRGKERVYSLDTEVIRPLLDLVQEHVDTYYKHYCKCTGRAYTQRWKNK